LGGIGLAGDRVGELDEILGICVWCETTLEVSIFDGLIIRDSVVFHGADACRIDWRITARRSGSYSVPLVRGDAWYGDRHLHGFLCASASEE